MWLLSVGLPGRVKSELDAAVERPGLKRFGHELGAVIERDGGGHAGDGDRPFQHAHDVVTAERRTSL